MVRRASSTGYNVAIPGECMLVVPRTADFLVIVVDAK